MQKIVCRMLLAAALALSLAARAQDYPSKPIKIILPFPPGGLLDPLGRIVADKFREEWGQPGVVEHRLGAGGNIGADAVAKASPDGYTLLLSPPGPIAINKLLYAKLTYDPEQFVPVSVLVVNPNALIVNPKLAMTDIQQLIAFGKANPGKINYASPGGGSTPHLSAELLQSMTGIKLVHVPYKGTQQAQTDVLSGQVDMMFIQLSNVLPQFRAGTLKILAVGSEKRNVFLPDVPTMNEVLPGFISSNWFGMVAPPGTPAALANKISALIAGALKQPETAKRMHDLSFEIIGSTPAEMAQFIRQESERWGKVIRVTGTKVE